MKRAILFLILFFLLILPDISLAAALSSQKQFQKAKECSKALNSSESKKRLRQNWEQCIKEYNSIAAKQRKYADDALFNIGSLYKGLYQYSKNLNDLDRAIDAYNKLIKKHPKSPYADNALFETGEILLKQKNSTDDALNAYKRLVKLYPKSRLKGNAEKRINDIRRTVALTSNNSIKPNYIKEIRSWSYPEYTRVVVEVESEISFNKKRISKPDRLYFDMTNTTIKEGLKKEAIPVSDGILKQIRVSQHTPKDARVVLDLGSIDDYRYYPLTDPNRLVIEIYGAKYKPQNKNVQEDSLANTGNTREKGIPLTQQLGMTIQTIVLDPGHGGKDPGAIGRNGLMEKDVTLDIAKRLKKILEKKADKKVYLTREDDTFISLEQRPAIANGKGADLFVSIHVNSNTKRSSRGIETYILNLSSNKWAQKTAARENMSSEKSIGDLEKIINDLVAEEYKEVSLTLAHAVQNNLVKTLKTDYSKIDDLGVKQAPFLVLVGTKMPSILAEVSFISNPDEEKRLRTSEYRQRIAEGLYEGIKKYISSSTIVALK